MNMMITFNFSGIVFIRCCISDYMAKTAIDFKVTFDDTGCNNRSVQAKDHITKKSEHVFSMV